MSELNEFEESKCPKCREWQPDLDGFGVLYCGKCGYCVHPSETKNAADVWVCNCCGKLTPDSLTVATTGQTQ